MSWQDRDYAGGDDQRPGFGRPGGDWGGLRPSFDNPLTWAFTIARVGGITVRVHVMLIVFMVVMILRSLSSASSDDPISRLSFHLMLATMGLLFVIVLAHEFGHCLACRWSGGQADEILMWPLGGLAMCRPRQDWKAHLLTAAGGPLVNVIVFVLVGVILLALTGKVWTVAIPNPFNFVSTLIDEPTISRSWAHMGLFLLQTLNLILLLFNLIPMFPLDGGKMLQSVLWPRFGYTGSMRFAVRSGYIGAILLGILGAVTNTWGMVGIALFGGITCYMTQKQLQFTDEMMGFESDEYALSLHGGPDKDEKEAASAKPSRQERLAKRQAELEQQESDEVDQILLKIARSGMSSLSRGERSLLERVTQRKREQG